MLNIYHENCSNRCRLAGPSTSHRSGEMPGSANTVLVLMIFSVRVRRRGQPYLCYIILPWVAVVAEPAEKGLVDAARRLPGFAVGRQVLSTVPQDGVGERHGRSLGEKTRAAGIRRRWAGILTAIKASKWRSIRIFRCYVRSESARSSLRDED